MIVLSGCGVLLERRLVRRAPGVVGRRHKKLAHAQPRSCFLNQSDTYTKERWSEGQRVYTPPSHAEEGVRAHKEKGEEGAKANNMLSLSQRKLKGKGIMSFMKMRWMAGKAKKYEMATHNHKKGSFLQEEKDGRKSQGEKKAHAFESYVFVKSLLFLKKLFVLLNLVLVCQEAVSRLALVLITDQMSTDIESDSGQNKKDSATEKKRKRDTKKKATVHKREGETLGLPEGAPRGRDLCPPLEEPKAVPRWVASCKGKSRNQFLGQGELEAAPCERNNKEIKDNLGNKIRGLRILGKNSSKKEIEICALEGEKEEVL